MYLPLITILTCFLVLLAVYFGQFPLWHEKRVKKFQDNARDEAQEETYKSIHETLHHRDLNELLIVSMLLDSEDKEDINKAKERLNATLDRLRRLARSMNEDYLMSNSLSKNIEDRLHLIPNYATSLKVEGEERKLDNEIVIFRIVQELISNVIKYAGANEIGVVMYYGSKLEIVIKDNGDKDFEFKEGGSGIIAIKNRLEKMKGGVEYGEHLVKIIV